MLNLLLVIAALYCAFQVMNASRLLNAAIWLAFTSALVSVLIYTLGAAGGGGHRAERRRRAGHRPVCLRLQHRGRSDAGRDDASSRDRSSGC